MDAPRANRYPSHSAHKTAIVSSAAGLGAFFAFECQSGLKAPQKHPFRQQLHKPVSTLPGEPLELSRRDVSPALHVIVQDGLRLPKHLVDTRVTRLLQRFPQPVAIEGP